MRIRKNAKLSTPIDSPGSRAESVHVCELNQSPWDVIPFAQEPYPSYLLHQFEPDDSFNGNGSLGDSVGAVESATSMMDGEDKSIMKVEDMVINDDDGMKMGDRFRFRTQCEDEGMGSKQDCSLKSCRHDNGDNPSSLTSRKAGNRRGRSRAGKKGMAAVSNPDEFYYYSGFRPSRGRRIRGGSSEMRKNIIVEGKDVENNSSAVTTQNNNTTPSSSSQFDTNEEFDYVDDDDEDDDEENVDSGGKKRMRKPVKARSLKSLM
ncbi:MATERNAL EFFECT EMBRYO ARREST 46, EMBRYO SAC DEVELOPMENT ARREST 8 [Hibiscus trionum]|uniref:MATERNAL EFFECT EMBRYO ARREST 46, EMBRYO SAC DEVELOPMENT ARREST 8 n=1 Tax=Hibiscus trionum TaxID=183268 RepID=A0A9W7GWY5_HIBTR|nr:MATERNAL EFFECT EMBRYO ARREST 46, EMBRYO SAC DEVELOPMENT ARREST 8 [Hibiscus trionum]